MLLCTLSLLAQAPGTRWCREWMYELMEKNYKINTLQKKFKEFEFCVVFQSLEFGVCIFSGFWKPSPTLTLANFGNVLEVDHSLG